MSDINQSIIKVNAPAKINLFLEVHDKRNDGYHNIESLMQTVSLYDEITISLSKGHGIEITSDNKAIHSNITNTAYKAARMFVEESQSDDAHIVIDIKKNIPISAGLGGGSADAAAVLLALNHTMPESLSLSRLYKIGKSIGADVPFCMNKGTAYVFGIGDSIQRVHPFPDCVFIIICYGEKKSTAAAYAKLDTIARAGKVSIENILQSVNKQDLLSCCKNYYNAFEQITPIPLVIQNILVNSGAIGMVLSGSGPSIVGTFVDMKGASAANELLLRKGFSTYIVKPVRR